MKYVIEKDVQVEAPADAVWRVLTDFARYPEWNPFVRECETSLKPGTPIRMQVALVGTQQVDEVIESCTPGMGFVYHMKPYPLGALSSRRSHEIVALGPDRSRYRSYFHLEGWLMPLVRALMGARLERGFAGMTTALKERAERTWARKPGSKAA
jgi:hypothetical protein